MTLLMVGVGAMGGAMAARLMERGHEVLGVDPVLAPVGRETLSPDGVRVVHDLVEVRAREVRPSEVLVFVRLADQVVDVLEQLDADPWYAGVPVAVLSTLSPHDARAIVERFGAQRPVVEAPVSGGVTGARQGTLTLLISGEPGAWLTDSASTVVRFAAPGLPAAAKLLNNALGAANALALTSALAQAEALGLAPEQMLDIIRTSSGGGWMADHFFDFPVDLLWKDFQLLHGDHAITFPSLTIDTDLVATVAAARETTTGNGANERK